MVRVAERRARIALVTPWPPERSGIADYARRLCVALSDLAEVIVVTGEPIDRYAPAPDGVRLVCAKDRSLDGLLKGCDALVYFFGNSHFHLHAHSLLARFPGAAVFHEVQLTGLYLRICERFAPDRAMPALLDLIRETYGDELPAGAIGEELPEWERLFELGVFMTREIRRRACVSFVHSQAARGLLERDSGGVDAPPAAVLPFGMPEVPLRSATRGEVRGAPLVVSLGNVNAIKSTDRLIAAFGRVAARRPHARLVFAGPVSESDERHWLSYSQEHARGACVEFTGYLEPADYAAIVGQADLAVQLRAVSTGEASAAIADCLAAGIPTIVSAVGWAAELPSDAVVQVAPSAEPSLIAERIDELLDDSAQRAELSAAAVRHASDNSFASVAAAYLAVLGLAGVGSPSGRYESTGRPSLLPTPPGSGTAAAPPSKATRRPRGR